MLLRAALFEGCPIGAIAAALPPAPPLVDIPSFGAPGPEFKRETERGYLLNLTNIVTVAFGFDPAVTNPGKVLTRIAMPFIRSAVDDVFTMRVWKRAKTDPNFNTAPPVAGDVLLDTVVWNSALQPNIGINAFVRSLLWFPMTAPIEQDVNSIIVVEVALTNAGAAKVTSTQMAAVPASSQAYYGWRKSTGGGAWTNNVAANSPQAIFYSEDDKTPITSYATPSAFSPETREILEWIKATNGGQSISHPSEGSYPGVSGTVGEGLAKLVSGDGAAAAWPAGQMQAGTDFGRLSGLPAGTAISGHPTYVGASRRAFVRDTTTAPNTIFDNYAFTNTYLDIGNGAFMTFLVSNSYMNGQADEDRAASVTPLDTSVKTDLNGLENARLLMSRSDIDNYSNFGVQMSAGVLDRLSIYDQWSDAVRIQGLREKRLMRSLMRRLGRGPQALSGATDYHCDGTQTSLNTADFIGYNNTYYIPFSDRDNNTFQFVPATSIYSEGSDGTTNCLNWNTDRAGTIPVCTVRDMGSVNELLIGGGWTVAVTPDDGDTFDSGFFVGSWFAKPYDLGGQYTAYGAIYPGPVDGGTPGKIVKNLLFHNCRWIEDQTPICKIPGGGVRGADYAGLYNYDKATAGYLFKVVATMLGYLDAIGDPVVSVGVF